MMHTFPHNLSYLFNHLVLRYRGTPTQMCGIRLMHMLLRFQLASLKQQLYFVAYHQLLHMPTLRKCVAVCDVPSMVLPASSQVNGAGTRQQAGLKFEIGQDPWVHLFQPSYPDLF